MHEQTLYEKFIEWLKDMVFKTIEPIFLWCVGFSDFDDYVEAIRND